MVEATDVSERKGQIGEAERQAIGPRRTLAEMPYLARTSPSIPDKAMKEAHKLIEADKRNTRSTDQPCGCGFVLTVRRVMSRQKVHFNCPHCDALYHVVPKRDWR